MSNPGTTETNPYAAPNADTAIDEFGRVDEFGGYAGFWRRLAAHLLDNLVVAAFFSFGMLAFGAVMEVVSATTGRQRLDPSVADVVGVSLFGLFVLAYVTYNAVMESSTHQATLGKMAMGIQVTDGRGRRISFLRSFARFVAKLVSSIPPFTLGYLLAAFSRRKRALHDYVAGTLVVRVP